MRIEHNRRSAGCDRGLGSVALAAVLALVPALLAAQVQPPAPVAGPIDPGVSLIAGPGVAGANPATFSIANQPGIAGAPAGANAVGPGIAGVPNPATFSIFDRPGLSGIQPLSPGLTTTTLPSVLGVIDPNAFSVLNRPGVAGVADPASFSALSRPGIAGLPVNGTAGSTGPAAASGTEGRSDLFAAPSASRLGGHAQPGSMNRPLGRREGAARSRPVLITNGDGRIRIVSRPD
ncbi:MAG TPA: hypothetical protein VMS56_14705 [Thermoanaerobaculia bacterium]|nr:hypothetical protein [Thermoanaerobaculia bacterium]